MEKWDQYHEDKRIKKKKQDVEMWEETVGEAAQKKIHMKGWFQPFFHKKIQVQIHAYTCNSFFVRIDFLILLKSVLKPTKDQMHTEL